jgi:type I restriction enzyme, S subunit
LSNGGAQELVGLTVLRSFPVPYPSLEKQNEIVKSLDALIIETKILQPIYQQKVNDLEKRKKSILQKGFAGELKTEKVVAV